MNTSNVNASAAAVANIVSGAVINALGLSSSSNNNDGSSTGAVTPAREARGSTRGQPDTLTARGETRNRNSRLEILLTYSEQHYLSRLIMQSSKL